MATSVCVSDLIQIDQMSVKIESSRNITNMSAIQGVSKKTEQIRNRSQRREAAQTIKSMIKIDCLGTYEVK